MYTAPLPQYGAVYFDSAAHPSENGAEEEDPALHVLRRPASLRLGRTRAAVESARPGRDPRGDDCRHPPIPRRGMRSRVRMDNEELPDWFAVPQGLRQGCTMSPPLLNVFFAAPPIEIIAVRFSEDEVIMQNLVHLKEEPGTGRGTPLDQVRRAVLANALRGRRRRRIEVGRRTGEDDDCNSGGLPGVRADGIGEEDGDPPDAREGRPITTTAVVIQAAGQKLRADNRVPVPGWLRQQTRRPHPRDQLPEQNSLGVLQEICPRTLPQAGRTVPPQDPLTKGGGHGSATVRLRDVVTAARALPTTADDTSSAAPL